MQLITFITVLDKVRTGLWSVGDKFKNYSSTIISTHMEQQLAHPCLLEQSEPWPKPYLAANYHR